MIDVLRKYLKPQYKSLNRIEIVAERILHNYQFLQSLQPQAEIFPVLKGNAYGHGLKLMCKILSNQTNFVAIDSYPEAQICYKYFKGKILLLSELPLAAYKYCDLKRTHFVVYNSETLKYLANNFPGCNIHLFYNCGMNREGIDDLNTFLHDHHDILKTKIKLQGFMSHLADNNLTAINNFFIALDTLKQADFHPPYIHLGNSAAIFNISDPRLTAFRAGLALYGYNPLNLENKNYQLANEQLNPALRALSTIINVRRIKSGAKVSYNGTFIAAKDMNLALIPFGYYEGLNTKLSNQAVFTICPKNHQYFSAQIAGRICMNMASLNCEDNSIKIGDEVEVISYYPGANSIQNLSNISEIISYEFLVKLDPGIRRLII